MKPRHGLLVSAGLMLLGIGLLAVPLVVRALPGRYASLLPEPLLALRHRGHPMTLPTAAVVDRQVEAGQPGLTASPVPVTATSSPAPTWTPTATATPRPSVTPELTATATATPTPTPTPPLEVMLDGLRHERQGWNNCGPTTLGMALSAWGRTETQGVIAPALKPDPEDKHVSMPQMAAYTRNLGLNAAIRANGTLEQLKAFLRAGIPVIVRTWYVRDERDQLGHYRLAIGYDDAAQTLDLYDSLYDPPTEMPYQELYELWRVFNWSYMVVAPPERWDDVTAILGPNIDDTWMYEQALARAQREMEEQPETCVAYAACSDWTTFSWLAAGLNLTALERHAEAAAAYDRARALGLHYRMLWYQHGPYESYYTVGRYDDVINLANATLATAGNLEESYYWRAKARIAQGNPAGAISDLQRALRYHAGWEPAVTLLAELEQ